MLQVLWIESLWSGINQKSLWQSWSWLHISNLLSWGCADFFQQFSNLTTCDISAMHWMYWFITGFTLTVCFMCFLQIEQLFVDRFKCLHFGQRYTVIARSQCTLQTSSAAKADTLVPDGFFENVTAGLVNILRPWI